MYSSGYSQVSKRAPGAQKRIQYRSKGKSCGYYMRIVFFFSSLIQSLIIVSLVLFLVYGKTQDSASGERIQDLEESFSRLSMENVHLRNQRRNLTNLLNITMTIKARNDWDLEKFRYYTNISSLLIQDYDMKLHQCRMELSLCKGSSRINTDCGGRTTDLSGCEHLKARMSLVESNFTHTVSSMRREMEQAFKERDYTTLETIRLRKDKSTKEKEMQFIKEKCKSDFFQSLSGVRNVSKAFLAKIESFFPAHPPFQITCPKQRDYLEQIHSNCTSLSREVEDRLQRYLDSVSVEVSDAHSENSRLKAENWRLSGDYRFCTQNRTGMIQEHRKIVEQLQLKHDQQREHLLVDKMRLNGEIDVLENGIKLKIKEVDHLTQQIRHLNMTCGSKTGFTGFAGASNTRTGSSAFSGSSSYGGGGSSSSLNSQLGRTGTSSLGSNLGSSGSLYNKPGSSSSSSSSGSSSSSSGSLFNKFGSSGTGSSSSSSGSSSNQGSSGSLFNKPGSSSSSSSSGSSSSSSGSLFNKFGSSGTGSSSSSSGSSSSLGSTGLNKQVSTGRSSGSSSNSGSSGSLFSKLGSTGTGSSSSSSGSSSNSGSSGSLFSKPGSSSTGSSSSSSSSNSGSSGSLFGKLGSSSTGSSSSSSGSSSNSGSSGSLFNKLGSTGTGSSSSSSGSSSNTGSLFSKLGSTGTGSSSSSSGSSSSLSLGANKHQTTNGQPSTGVGSSSSGSAGSSTKPFSSWFGLGLGNNNAGKTGTGTGGVKPLLSGGTGSTFGGARSSGYGGGGGGTVNVVQHIQALERLMNPSSEDERQDLSRMLG